MKTPPYSRGVVWGAVPGATRHLGALRTLFEVLLRWSSDGLDRSREVPGARNSDSTSAYGALNRLSVYAVVYGLVTLLIDSVRLGSRLKQRRHAYRAKEQGSE